METKQQHCSLPNWNIQNIYRPFCDRVCQNMSFKTFWMRIFQWSIYVSRMNVPFFDQWLSLGLGSKNGTFVRKTLNNYWMKSSRIWGIIKAEVCVICPSRWLKQITQTEALIMPHILREPYYLFLFANLFLQEVICILNFGISSISHLYFAFGISNIN